MIFPHSFYEDEIRCDYIVPSMIKRTWAAQLEILDDLDKICRENDLKYCAEWGTLLGTIRHGGFIPWDDDLAVSYTHLHYDRIVKGKDISLPYDYSIVNYRSNRDFKQMLSRIVSSDHYRFDPEYMKKYSGLPFALGIDIFPLDYLSGDEEYEKEREKRVRLVYDAVNEIAHFGTDPADIDDHLKKVERICKVSLDRSSDILTQLRELLEILFAEVDEKDAKYVTLYPLWMNGHSYRFPKEYYERTVRMPFENTTIPVPVCYDAILRHKYGKGYMTPVRSGGAHEYPYYEEHVKVLREHFGFEWPSYKFEEKDICAPREKVETFDGGTAVFITYSLNAFENMRRIVRQYIKKGYDVTILVPQAFDIAPDMSGITPSEENVPDDLYLRDLEGARVTHDLSVLDRHPNVIVTNYPYDEYNLITTIDRACYSLVLRNKCDRLIYVPPFEAKSVKEEDERAIKLMPQYVCTPMCARCDELILSGEEMKLRYTECLTEHSGERFRSVWEDKIRVFPAAGKVEHTADSPAKKKILFYVGLSTFAEHGSAAVEKIAGTFKIFDAAGDKIEPVYLMQYGLLDDLQKMYPGLYEEYMAHDFRPEADYVDTDEIDAYYGEASLFATEFLNTNKPVMIMDVNV